MANKITTLLEFVGADKTANQVKGLSKEFQAAEGFSNKAKVAWRGAGDVLKNNLAEVAVGAGVALVGLGVKSVQAFTDTALAAGKASDATGVLVEDQSRWIEVAGDLGISSNTLTGLFTKMNKAIGSNSPVVKELGLELQRNADGSANVSATMLKAIEAINAITDPTERAKKAQELFGRGYAESSELIFDSAENVRRKLGEVADAKVIDEKELKRARELRDSMDNLRDVAENAAISFGSRLAPAVSDVADIMTKLSEKADEVGGVGPGGVLGKLDSKARELILPINGLTDKLSDLNDVLGGDEPADYTEELSAMADADRRAATAANAQREIRDDLAAATDQARQYTEVAAAATEALADADAEAEEEARRNLDTMRRLTDEYNDQKDAIDDVLDAKRELVGGDLAVKEAQRQAAESAAALTETLKDQDLSLGDVAAAIEATADEQLNAASAAAEFKAKQMEANGSVVDAQTKNYLLRTELEKLAAQAEGPLKAAIQAMIDQLNAIPSNKTVNIAVLANGQRINTGGGLAIGVGGAATISADGNYNHPAGPGIINDGTGPELVELPGGSKVMTAGNTRNYLRQMGEGEAAQPFAVHFHQHYNRIVAVGSPNQVAGALSRRVKGRS